MVKEIVKDIMFLSRKSEDATVMDIAVIRDIKDTYRQNRENCVGMAANMIGYLKNVIIFEFMDDGKVMVNPKILSFSGEYTAEEGCLSLSGVRKVKRYEKIKVRYLDEKFTEHTDSFCGWSAEIIQHEIDHCNGIII